MCGRACVNTLWHTREFGIMFAFDYFGRRSLCACALCAFPSALPPRSVCARASVCRTSVICVRALALIRKHSRGSMFHILVVKRPHPTGEAAHSVVLWCGAHRGPHLFAAVWWRPQQRPAHMRIIYTWARVLNYAKCYVCACASVCVCVRRLTARICARTCIVHKYTDAERSLRQTLNYN